MGATSFNSEARGMRANSAGYHDHSAPDSKVFRQSIERKIAKDMDPHQISVRECRDSEVHPVAFPVIVALDETGSMANIPRQLCSEGLPHIISSCQQKGLSDISLCFLGIGDHEISNEVAPLQIGQFESGDAELDHWLTSVFLERLGGGNRGESYLLAHLFAGYMTETDHWDKRKEKGVLITIGDEPNLEGIDIQGLLKVLGSGYPQRIPELAQVTYLKAAELISRAQERWNVHHIHVLDGAHGSRPIPKWVEALGEKFVHPVGSTQIPETIAKIVAASAGDLYTETPPSFKEGGEVPEKEQKVQL